MEDKNKLADDVRLETKQGSGSLLASARKKQNRSVEEIADELNLSVTQIRTIELDQSEGLPEPTYVRGYIRSYAKLLGLNADKVLEHYLNPNWQKGSRLDEMPRGIGSANEPESGGFFTPLKVVSFIALLGIVGFLWLTGKLDGLLNGQEATVVSAPVEQTRQAPAISQPDAAVVAPSSQTTETANEETSSAPVTEPVGDIADEVSNEHRLSLEFSDTSWVDIRDAEGNRLAYKSYAEGEPLNVASATKMSVFIGNAKAVSVKYNGDDFDISQFREGVFARFTVGE